MPGYLVTCRGMPSRRAGERARSHLVAHRGTPPLSLALAVFPVTITAQRGLLRARWDEAAARWRNWRRCQASGLC